MLEPSVEIRVGVVVSGSVVASGDGDSVGDGGVVEADDGGRVVQPGVTLSAKTRVASLGTQRVICASCLGWRLFHGVFRVKGNEQK